MMNHKKSSRMPSRAVLASAAILASGAGFVLAFQEPATVSSRPVTANEITPPAEILPAAAPAPLAVERPEDVAAIRALTESFVKAFNAGDSAAEAKLFTENARIVDEENTVIEGRGAISARFARSFAEHPGESIVVTPETIRFLGPDTAIEEGTAAITIPATEGEGTPPEVETTRYTVVYVKRDGTWLHASIRDHLADVASESASAGTNYEHLKALEWLVGDWVEEGQDVELNSSFAWTDNRNFLIRTFNLKVPGRPPLNGSQRIGWDPSTRQIRSWEFDSDGSFGEGVWSRRGDNGWIVKMTGVRHDGRIASDTRVVTRTGPDQLTWRAVDRTLAGDVQDDTPEFVMVRSAPTPGEAKAKRVTQ